MILTQQLFDTSNPNFFWIASGELPIAILDIDIAVKVFMMKRGSQKARILLRNLLETTPCSSRYFLSTSAQTLDSSWRVARNNNNERQSFFLVSQEFISQIELSPEANNTRR
jgi:hypothetical protein